MAVLELQAGAGSLAGSLDPKLGIVALKLKCRAADLQSAITGTLPDIGITGLVEWQPRTFDRSVAGENAGYDVFVTLEGHLTPAQADGEDFSLEGTTSDDPIESHHEYQTLLKVYNGKEGSDGKAKWPKTLPDSQNTFAGQPGAASEGERNRMHGVENFLVPGETWTRKSVSQFLPASIVRDLGTISTPPGDPPPISGGRNWLKIRGRATRRGNVWQIEETWLLSGPDGWVPEMYRRKSS